MIGEFDIYGVYFPALAVFAAIAFVASACDQAALDASGLLSFRLASRAVRLAIYVILLAAVTAAATTILPLA